MVHDRWSPSRIARALAFAVVCVLLGLEWAMTRRAFETYDGQLSAIYEGALPSVEHGAEVIDELTELRRDLRTFNSADTSDAGRADAEVHARTVLSIIDHHLKADAAAPQLPGEPALQERRRDELELLLRDADALLRCTTPEARRAAMHETVTVTDTAYTTVSALLRLNAHDAARTTHRVLAAQENAVQWTRVLTVSFIVLAVALWSLSERYVRRLERQREETLAELDAFVGRVAHDLRGPLAPIMIGLAVIQRESGKSLSDRARLALERAETAFARVTSLIEGLLAFARAGGQIHADASVALESVANGVATNLEATLEEERARLTMEIEPGLHVRASSGAVASILENLLRNAVLYLGDSEERAISLRARSVNRGAVLLEIADSGPGIPDDVLRRLFRPFQRGTTQRPGHGLGLATVRRLAEGHGGHVEVSSRIGSGTTFRVYLSGGVVAAAAPAQTTTRTPAGGTLPGNVAESSELKA